MVSRTYANAKVFLSPDRIETNLYGIYNQYQLFYNIFGEPYSIH